MDLAQDDPEIGVIILTGEGPNAFCSGGDQSVRGEGGYDDGSEPVPRLRVLDLHIQVLRQARAAKFYVQQRSVVTVCRLVYNVSTMCTLVPDACMQT